jgi:hypothetical protein
MSAGGQTRVAIPRGAMGAARDQRRLAMVLVFTASIGCREKEVVPVLVPVATRDEWSTLRAAADSAHRRARWRGSAHPGAAATRPT